MKKRLYITLAIVLALLSSFRVTAQDNSNILRHSINYHVDSVDMWGGGDATFIDFDYSLIDLCVGGECEGSDFPIHQMFGTNALGIAFDFDLYMYPTIMDSTMEKQPRFILLIQFRTDGLLILISLRQEQ